MFEACRPVRQAIGADSTDSRWIIWFRRVVDRSLKIRIGRGREIPLANLQSFDPGPGSRGTVLQAVGQTMEQPLPLDLKTIRPPVQDVAPEGVPTPKSSAIPATSSASTNFMFTCRATWNSESAIRSVARASRSNATSSPASAAARSPTCNRVR